jgi:hypothetical protein
MPREEVTSRTTERCLFREEIREQLIDDILSGCLPPGTPNQIGPPWSWIVAYDLNAGTIKWKLPLGDDLEAVNLGGKNTGVLQGGEHHGMVVTSTGLVFANARDCKLRAFDADNGKVLWTRVGGPACPRGIGRNAATAGRRPRLHRVCIAQMNPNQKD